MCKNAGVDTYLQSYGPKFAFLWVNDNSIREWRSLKDEQSSIKINDIGCPTYDNSSIEIIADNSALSNHISKENAATSAKVNGVKTNETVKKSYPEYRGVLAARHPIIALHWGLAA